MTSACRAGLLARVLTACAFGLLPPALPGQPAPSRPARVRPSPAPSKEAQASRSAEEAIRLAGQDPEQALILARRALALTEDFEPTAFVKAGRKGEVVEDAYLAARLDYRRHRARLYEAVGRALGAASRHAEAVRYLRRATLLDPDGEALNPLARSLTALGQGALAVQVVLGGTKPLGVESVALAGQAADAAGLPSLQAEIDRVRILALAPELKVEYREGPLRAPDRSRLSTGPAFRLDEAGVTVLYIAETSCRSCSADLDALKKLVPAGMRTVMVPIVGDEDASLRRAIASYRYDWPFVLGPSLAKALDVPAPSALVVARGGWSGALVRSPFAPALPAVLSVFGRDDAQETVPRPSWNKRPVARPPVTAPPGLLPEGLASGEDSPAPPEFETAVDAYRGRRFEEALKAFEALQARGDGWLLPPEARLNRALCLAALGRREEARRLLLRTGDGRFQEAVDRTLEAVGSGTKN